MEAGKGVLRAEEGSDSAFGGDLPRLAARRLVIGAWLTIFTGVVVGLVSFLRQPNVGVREGTERPMFLIPVGLVLSVGLLLVARSERVRAATRVDVGLAYLVLMCLIAGLFRHWLPYVQSDVVRGITPTAVLVLFVAVFIPVPPRRMAITATLCGLCDAAALAITVWGVGNPAPPWNLWLWLLLPNGVMIAVAYFASRFVYQLGESVRKAKAMGAYHLVDKLGQGGMGEVWRAEHRSLARPAAIKLVRPSLLGNLESAERVLGRFEREARATAALTSPHTIAVFDYGRAEDGAFYYVMELLEGMDLQTMVNDHGPLPAARVVHLLLQACHSLDEAHGAGLVHRDIKPANLYVGRVGTERDFLKVLDFGLVKLEGTLEAPTDDEDAAALTADGALIGTPGYIAPELGLGGRASPAADLYSLGCVAYFLLTGRLVFGNLALVQQIYAHGYETPEPPSTHAEVDPALDALVMRCLAKAPEDRPASAAALAAALRETGLAPGWTQDHAAAWWAEVEPVGSAESLGFDKTVELTEPAT